MKQRLILFLTTLTMTLGMHAQDAVRVRRGDCTPVAVDEADGARGAKSRRALPKINTEWDQTRTYRQLVILVSFSDCDFNSDDPKAHYEDMLNSPGYSERKGAGSMADYFRDQSGGMLNLQFDVFGPYKLSSKVQPYTTPNANTHNYGQTQMRTATQMFIEETTPDDNSNFDFSPYDWNGDGVIEQVIYIFAGLSGNAGESTYGYLWPNTSSFAAISTPDGHTIANYSSSAEHWPTTSKASCGIGTICHEYSHSLGLPDMYPTSSSVDAYSIVDEWDLMDGGNFTNYGCCPPNYTAHEKMLMGWLTPTELTEPATIKDMKPLSEGGVAYIINHTENEYLLLENRQWTGWDACSPGRGLVVYHVNYVANEWSANRVNNVNNKPNFHLVPADGKTYTQWATWFSASGLSSKYAETGHSHNLHLSTSPYPTAIGETGDSLNAEITDTSDPSDMMYNRNSEGSMQLSKSITNITMDDEGNISFDFMGGVPTAITDNRHRLQPAGLFDLNGRSVEQSAKGLLIERRADGSVRKIVK